MTEASRFVEVADEEVLNKAPLVSVYMLAFQHERFIGRAIEGVLNQECDFPVELVIGEDGSTDGTRRIVLDYQKRHPGLIRVLLSKVNSGAFENSMRCIHATRGKYVAICEGDDYWHHSGKLQMQVDLMESNAEMPLCHTDFDRLTGFRRRRQVHRRTQNPWLAKGESYVALLHDWSIMTATSMYQRKVLTSFIDSAFNRRDWPFGDRNKMLFASLHGPIGYLDISTATFRKRRGSATNSGALASLRMAEAALDCVRTFMTSYPVCADIERSVLARGYSILYKSAYLAGRLDHMDEAYANISNTEYKRSRLAHSILRLLCRLKYPVKAHRAVRALIERYISGM
jgi:glycosyltransferase involved in cell wall biosynthesis